MSVLASWLQSAWIFLGSILFLTVLFLILYKILAAQNKADASKNPNDAADNRNKNDPSVQ